MKKTLFWKTVLMLSGVNACVIGAGLLLDPIWFESLFNVKLEQNASMLSELRGPGGGLLCCGVIIISGAFVTSLTFSSLLLSSALYLSYAVARTWGIVVDGMPNADILNALIFEFTMGVIVFVALIQFRRKRIQPD